MTDTVMIRLPRSIIERLEYEASRAGLLFEEYFIGLILQYFDRKERVQGYIEAAISLIEQGHEDLEVDNMCRAAGKLWSATALAIKAYADWRDGRQLKGHGELWRYKEVLEKELGEWVYCTWMIANGMHICFYEGWCSKEDVIKA